MERRIASRDPRITNTWSLNFSPRTKRDMLVSIPSKFPPLPGRRDRRTIAIVYRTKWLLIEGIFPGGCVAAARGRPIVVAVRGRRVECEVGGGDTSQGGDRGGFGPRGASGSASGTEGGATSGEARGAAHRVTFRDRRAWQAAREASSYRNCRGG